MPRRLFARCLVRFDARIRCDRHLAVSIVRRAGWSVVAKGRLDELTQYDGDAWDDALEAHIEPWAAGNKSHILCLHIDRLTGRRVGDAA